MKPARAREPSGTRPELREPQPERPHTRPVEPTPGTRDLEREQLRRRPVEPPVRIHEPEPEGQRPQPPERAIPPAPPEPQKAAERPPWPEREPASPPGRSRPSQQAPSATEVPAPLSPPSEILPVIKPPVVPNSLEEDVAAWRIPTTRTSRGPTSRGRRSSPGCSPMRTTTEARRSPARTSKGPARRPRRATAAARAGASPRSSRPGATRPGGYSSERRTKRGGPETTGPILSEALRLRPSVAAAGVVVAAGQKKTLLTVRFMPSHRSLHAGKSCSR